jgi:hypothetical protein
MRFDEIKQSTAELPPGACPDCGGEGQVQGVCATSPENPEGVYAEVCKSCKGSGLARVDNPWKTYALALKAYHDNAMDIAHEVDLRTGPSLALREKDRALEVKMLAAKAVAEKDDAGWRLLDFSGGLSNEELIIACKNIGFDLTCGACAGQFYTGAQLGEHTCPSGGRTEAQRADGAEAALSLVSERCIRAEAKCKQLLVAIQTATVGDLTGSDRRSKYRGCLLCRRDLNVCERDFRVAVETNALDRACRGAKVRALALESAPTPRSQAMNVGFQKIYSPYCIDCDGKGQLREFTGPDDNHDGLDCVTCAGTGLKYPPIRDLVRAFHEAFQPEQGTGTDHPHVPDEASVRLRLRLVFEEAFELLKACTAKTLHFEDEVMSFIQEARMVVDIVEVADALADLAYVIEGANLAYGIDSRSVLAESAPK